MRQSKSLGNLGGSLPLRKKTGSRDAPERELEYPASADAYELLEDCGRGVSATVWRARCLTNNQIVAVKILNLEAQMAPLDIIMHEAQTMKAYKHEAILSLYVSFVVDTALWMVMPYMEGGSVAHIMRYKFPDGLEEPVIATIMKEVISALAYIHSHNGIHRDVKAGNVLVDAQGHVALGDFGVSASMERDADWGGPKQRQTFVGTPCWMAPEVLDQRGHGPKADIWSAGITMLEMAHGHAPFSKLPPMKVLLQTLQGPPPQLEAECGGRHFSRGMREVVASCLNKDPNKRPTAKQLLTKGFFRQAKDADYLKRTLLAGLPPLPQRCMEIRMGKGRAATLALENDKAAVASHISYIADVAQWDFNCTKTSAEAGPETAASSWSSGGAKSAAGSFTSTAATSGSRPSSSRGDQLVEQPHHQQQEQQLQGQQGAAAGGPALGSSNSLDVPGQQQQQSVVGLGGLMAQQQQQEQVLAPQLSGDVGPGAKDVDGSVGDAAQAGPGAAVTSDKVPSPVRSPSPKAPAAAGQPRVLTCYAGGKTITTFPVSVPDTPDHSPMHSRPSTPELQAALAAGAGEAGRHLRPAASSYPGAAAAGSSSSAAVVVPGAKKLGRFTFVEGSARYQGPELAADASAAAEPTAAAAGAASKPGQLLKQRSVSSPDMALLMRLQAPRSSTSSNGSAGGSALSDQPLSPLSPASALSPAVSPKAGLAASAEAAAATGVSSPGQPAPATAATLSSSGTRAVEQQQVSDGKPSLAVASSPRGSSGGLGLEASAMATAGGAASPQQPRSPPQQHLEQHEHHHNLQHKIAGFFAHHGLGKGSKGASPFVSRDVSPNVSQDMGHAAISSTRVSAAGVGSSSSNAAMSSLSRPANPLHEIYSDSYGSREASKAGVAHSPRSMSPRAGGKEHATAAQIWQHIKEACAEAASDVGHIFKSRSGGSLAHTDRTTSRSPERPKQQQRTQSTSPQPSDRAVAAAAGPAGEQVQQDSGHLGRQAQPLSSPGDGGAAVGAIKEGPAGAGAARSGSSSNLVRLGSRGSGSMPPIVSLGAGSSSSSKPPRYQQTLARRVSDEQHMKQPLSPQRQDLQAAPEQQQQEELAKHQAVLQQELQAMQQQQGPEASEVQEAASAVSTLAAAAAAVKQAAVAAAGDDSNSAAAAAAAAAADGVSSGVHDQLGSHDTVFAVQQHPGAHESATAGTRDETAPVTGLNELGSRELSFAAPSNAASSGAAGAGGSGDGLASHALDSPGQEQGVAQESSVTFPALTGSGSCQPPQQQQQRSLSPSRPGVQMQQQRPASPFAMQPQPAGVSGGGAQPSQRTAGAAGAAASGVASGSSAGPTLMGLRAAESLGPADRASGRDIEPQRGRPRLSAAEAAALPEAQQQQQQQGLSVVQPSSRHPSASPSKHQQRGRFTIKLD